MANVYTGTAGDNTWKIVDGGNFTLDGLGGVDTLDFGTAKRSDFTIVQNSDGSVKVDTLSGASAPLHATLKNMEILTFNNGRDLLDLRTLFTTTLTGTSGNDSFAASAGTLVIDGLAGVDTVTFSGLKADYTVAAAGTGWTVTNTATPSNKATLTNIERLVFSDARLALDTASSQSGGEATLLLGAVLPGQLVYAPEKQALLGAVIGLFDQGFTFAQLAGALMRLDIWGILANGGNPGATNTQIANYLLTNVRGVAPDTATLQAAAAALDSEAGNFAIQGNFLYGLAASTANQSHVSLVGLATSGVNFAS